MKTSVFDLFKVGIGPSSSHTVGPMRAAREFAAGLSESKRGHCGVASTLASSVESHVAAVSPFSLPGAASVLARIKTELFGSLALTGLGHATDRAILLGLSGEKPETVEPAAIESIVAGIRAEQSINVLGQHRIAFIEARDLLFLNDQTLPGHPNAMRFTAFDAAGETLQSAVYYSIGGGFIVCESNSAGKTPVPPALPVPNPFSSGAELLAVSNRKALPIWRIILEMKRHSVLKAKSAHA